MPAARPLRSRQEQKEAREAASKRILDAQRVEEEIGLYDPSGPWRFFEEKLRKHEAKALKALEDGPYEEVLAAREVLKVIRDLLAQPAKLRATRELLAQEMSNE